MSDWSSKTLNLWSHDYDFLCDWKWYMSLRYSNCMPHSVLHFHNNCYSKDSRYTFLCINWIVWVNSPLMCALKLFFLNILKFIKLCIFFYFMKPQSHARSYKDTDSNQSNGMFMQDCYYLCKIVVTWLFYWEKISQWTNAFIDNYFIII